MKLSEKIARKDFLTPSQLKFLESKKDFHDSDWRKVKAIFSDELSVLQKLDFLTLDDLEESVGEEIFTINEIPFAKDDGVEIALIYETIWQKFSPLKADKLIEFFGLTLIHDRKENNYPRPYDVYVFHRFREDFQEYSVDMYSKIFG